LDTCILRRLSENKKSEPLKKALISYNKWLGSYLSLRKLLSNTQHITEAYKIGSDSQRNDLDIQITKIVSDVTTKNIPDVDSDLISLVGIAKEITKNHKSILGFSIKYPLKFMFWEQTKISLSRNYPKLMYLFLGIIILVILKQFNLFPISLP
jgi:hypothetical protein